MGRGPPAAKKRRLSPDADVQENYERKPRKIIDKNGTVRLPVKSSDGWTAGPKVTQDSTKGIERASEDVESDTPEDEPIQPTVPTKSAREQILAAQEELARIAAAIGEDPEEHVGQLKQLEAFSESHNVTIRKLALATQLAVYKDIIPGYRIRPAAPEEMTGKLSKDVKKLRNFEQGLVVGYREYVKSLGRLSKASSRDSSDHQRELASVALACACALLNIAPHFNFRSELLNIIVRKLSNRSVDADFVKCRETIETLFADDEDGVASLEAVGLITRMIKARDYRVHESVLNTFLHLRLLSEFVHKASQNRIDKVKDDGDVKFKKVFRTKKERKSMRETKAVAKEMEEADAEVSYEDREKNQSEMLKSVFVAYFRILKARVPNLMGAVLEGLASYAHLINQDFFGDILEALRDLVAATANVEDDADDQAEDSEQIDQAVTRDMSREALLCIITAFALLQGQEVAKSASSLHLDLNFFITHLYRTLLQTSLDADIELKSKSLRKSKLLDNTNKSADKRTRINVQTTIVLLLRSLSSVLHPPTNMRSIPPLRLAAFCKQIATISLQLPEKSCLAMIGLLRQITKVNGGKIAALWHSEERKGDGVFDPLRDEVEASNPFAATVWEGVILRQHYSPAIREGIIGLEKQLVQSRT